MIRGGICFSLETEYSPKMIRFLQKLKRTEISITSSARVEGRKRNGRGSGRNRPEELYTNSWQADRCGFIRLVTQLARLPGFFPRRYYRTPFKRRQRAHDKIVSSFRYIRYLWRRRGELHVNGNRGATRLDAEEVGRLCCEPFSQAVPCRSSEIPYRSCIARNLFGRV